MIALWLACNDGPGDTWPETAESGEDDTELPGREEEELPPEPDVVVDCNGGGDFTTINAAIAGSVSGTHIGLKPCTYREDINFLGKSLDIFGIEGSGKTTIQGNGGGAAVRVVHGETVGTRLAGVTISGGRTTGYAGAGLYVDLATIALDDVVFSGNLGGDSVVYANGAWIEMTDVAFHDNKLDAGGQVVIFTNGSAVLQRVTMTCGASDKTGIYQHNALLLLDSDIRCGTDFGIYNQGNGTHVRRSRVESDGIAFRGGDSDDTRNERVWLYNSAFIGGDTAAYTLYMDVEVENSVFWGGRIGLELLYANPEAFVYNSAFEGSECGLKTVETYDVGWNAIDRGGDCGDQGHDVVDADFGFVDPPADFKLAPGSPLIDAGNPDEEYADQDDSRNDIGIYGGREGEGQR